MQMTEDVFGELQVFRRQTICKIASRPLPAQGLGTRSDYFRKKRQSSCEKYLLLCEACAPLTRADAAASGSRASLESLAAVSQT